MDVNFIVDEYRIIFDTYKNLHFLKDIFYLNFHSQHPVYHKRDVIFSLFDKIFLLSHPKFHFKNITYMIQILLRNGYPLSFIFSSIQMRIKFHSYNRKITKNQARDYYKYLTVPFVRTISESFSNIEMSIQKCQFKTFMISNILKKYITGKNTLDSNTAWYCLQNLMPWLWRITLARQKGNHSNLIKNKNHRALVGY